MGSINSEIPPLSKGACIGILGGGQLGLMLVDAAHKLGYKCIVWDENDDAPAFDIADYCIAKSFSDSEALEKFIAKAKVATLEFENIPCDLVEKLSEHMPHAPSAKVLEIVQNRILEKSFFADNGIPCAPWWSIKDESDLKEKAKEIHYPAVLKTCRWGYDGKGQISVRNADELRDAWHKLGKSECIVEQYIAFDKEVSAIGARDWHGNIAVYPIAENKHENHILHTSTAPVSLDDKIVSSAESHLRTALHKLDHLGVAGLLAMEFFVVGDNVLANEMAARPHNSGHWTMDGAHTSQFEQAIRAVSGLTLGDTSCHTPICMYNLLGDEVDNIREIVGSKESKIYRYGKTESRPGRKMGHINFIGNHEQYQQLSLPADLPKVREITPDYAGTEHRWLSAPTR